MLKLRQMGLDVYAIGRDVAALQELASSSGAKAVQADVRDKAALAARFADIEVDILINNAGILSTRALFHEIDPAEIDAMIDVNLKAPMHLTRAVLPGMVARKKGHLIFIGSTGGQAPYPSMIFRNSGRARSVENFVATGGSLTIRFIGISNVPIGVHTCSRRPTSSSASHLLTTRPIQLCMLYTFPPAREGMEAEFREEASRVSPSAEIESFLVDGAIDAVRAGDEATHNRLVAETAATIEGFDAITLAHFSTARALEAVQAATPIPVLTSPDAAVAKLRRLLT